MNTIPITRHADRKKTPTQSASQVTPWPAKVSQEPPLSLHPHLICPVLKVFFKYSFQKFNNNVNNDHKMGSNFILLSLLNTQSNTSQQAAATHCRELSSISSLDRHMIILRSIEGQRAKRPTRDRDGKKKT